MKTQTKHSLMLMLCAFIWGTAFVAQSAGSGMGAYSFLAGRSWLAVLVLIPTVFAFDAVRKKQEHMTRRALAAFARVQKAGRDAVIVTHGGVIAAIMAHLFPEGKNRYEWQSPNGGGYVIEDGEYTPFSPR